MPSLRAPTGRRVARPLPKSARPTSRVAEASASAQGQRAIVRARPRPGLEWRGGEKPKRIELGGSMSEVQDGLTIGEVFASAVASHGDRPFFMVPPNAKRDHLKA